MVLFVAVIGVLSWLLAETRLGRYMYAIGANPEAARRAGINVTGSRRRVHPVRVTAGIAGLVYESGRARWRPTSRWAARALRRGAAVIGGTSLFGGRGKILHALLGGIVIAAVFNGLA